MVWNMYRFMMIVTLTVMMGVIKIDDQNKSKPKCVDYPLSAAATAGRAVSLYYTAGKLPITLSEGDRFSVTVPIESQDLIETNFWSDGSFVLTTEDYQYKNDLRSDRYFDKLDNRSWNAINMKGFDTFDQSMSIKEASAPITVAVWIDIFATMGVTQTVKVVANFGVCH